MTFTRFIKMIGVTALTACVLLGAQAQAQPQRPHSSEYYQARCDRIWGKTTAAKYCPNAIVDWHGNMQCAVRVTCTVDVQVGGIDRRISQEVSSGSIYSDLTLCFSRTTRTHEDGNVVWNMSMHGRCGAKIDVTTAIEDGLPAN